MAIEQPDFANWTEEGFATRADEICEYFHSFDWLGRLPGPRHETYLELAVRAERTIEKPTEASRNQIAEAVCWARDEGTSWERIAELLGTSAAEAQQRYESPDVLSHASSTTDATRMLSDTPDRTVAT
ncbi:hypothetical protein [Candidatus Poriferisodalis sp.]|uniref:hypothetical protein n=1 Tax=Candidatus Poriferisodalis sp. TaxID=3101277 RepID=UPI003AF8ACD6